MIPIKPFDTYKWRWLSGTPTESLLDPPVFLGVLRVLARHEGQTPANVDVVAELSVVQTETGSPVNLARTGDRNLVRNSGQYWKGTGLLSSDRGEIRLTSLGRGIASGHITQGEFAAVMVQQTSLPNPWTYTKEEIDKWISAELEIRPLALILEVIEELGRRYGEAKAAYLTTRELIRIVIPLAGNKIPGQEIARFVSLNRASELDLSGWPDCAPASNDHRLAREFLLFLSNFGLCRKVEASPQLDERFYLDELFDVAALSAPTAASIFTDEASRVAVVEAIQHSALPSIIDRQRTMTTMLRRPGQMKFRERILVAYCSRCFLTGEMIPEVLEAAHIIPVTNGGADASNNGICLRVDVHRLFDSGNIRLKQTGELMLSNAVAASPNYSSLPRRVVIPDFVNPANVSWRDAYL